MMKRCCVGLPLLALLLAGSWLSVGQAEQTPTAPASVKVVMLTYAKGKTGECFAAGFLEEAARRTNLPVQRTFETAVLGVSDLRALPFCIMTGEGSFKLSDAEVQALRDYLRQGGFLLASAGCSDERWAQSMQQALKQAAPKLRYRTLKADHPVFHTVFDLDGVRSKKGPAPEALQGLELDGKLVGIFTPVGVNDTGNAGGECCCCGGNELQDAHLININILAYVLTR